MAGSSEVGGSLEVTGREVPDCSSKGAVRNAQKVVRKVAVMVHKWNRVVQNWVVIVEVVC